MAIPETPEPDAAAGRAAGHGGQPLQALAEAAAELGCGKERLRAMIRRGTLKAVRGNSGQWLVAVPEEMRRQRGRPRPSVSAGHSPADANGSSGDTAGRMADRAAERFEALAGRVADLEEAVEEWRAAAEEARLTGAVTVAERDAAREMVAELRAQLAEARRPVWRRWLGRS